MPSEVAAIDAVVADLVGYYESRSVKVMIVSEYGISAVSKPIHLNRLFREKGWITIKDELGLETLDCGASKVFAVADHQVAHVYVNDPDLLGEVRSLLERTDGIDEVRTMSHERAGDLIAISKQDAWFTYYFWYDDAKAPDYARCVDIHRKPGYDPVELFLDPAIPFPKLKIAKFLLKKRLGFRGLMDVIPLDASLVKGSHGRDNVAEDEQPLVIGAPIPVQTAEDIAMAIRKVFVS
ncbi:MAG: hypothetical protein CFE26_13805 [Verrucomicrobiales bacterium VVV1]|nr:MAG: hypothetical protein CFE26_13805 [Verrucomicrobiales bacterium VVV1]